MIRRSPQRSRKVAPERRSATINVIQIRDQVRASSNIYYLLRAEFEEPQSSELLLSDEHVVAGDFERNKRSRKSGQVVGVLGSNTVH